MNIKGYVEIIFHSQTWHTYYDIVELVRYKGDLWWRFGRTVSNKWKIEGLPHIATWHFQDYEHSIKMYEENNLGLAFKYEVHHLERIWCRNGD